MPTNTSGGTTASFVNTPQAQDDTFNALTEEFFGTYFFNVLGNDLGGKAKVLWSIDNGTNNTGTMGGYIAGDLLTQDKARTEALSTDTSAHGARIWITADGQVGYDASTLDGAFRSSLSLLPAGGELTDTFTYAIRLGNGTLSWATATIHFSGTNTEQNHAPIVTSSPANATGSITELAGITGSPTLDSAGGTLTYSDQDLADTHSVAQSGPQFTYSGGALTAAQVAALASSSTLSLVHTDANGSSSGSIGWTYRVGDAAIDFLGAGDVLTVIYTVTISDGHGGTATQNVSVTIAGSNDTAVIGLPSVSDVTEDVAVDANGFLTASGSISVSDADRGQSAFQPVVTGSVGNYGTLSLAADGTYTYSVANSAVQGLGATDTKVDTFTITTVDGTSKSVSFTIHGADDASVIGTPTVTDVSDGAVGPDGSISVSGEISIIDADGGQAYFIGGTFGAGGGGGAGGGVGSGAGGSYLGTFTLGADGGYTYSVPGGAVQYLGDGETATETFIVMSTGGTTQTVTFTIHGTNDAAMIGEPAIADVTEDVSVNPSGFLIASGAIPISDPDQGQSLFQTGVTGDAGNLGALALAADGSYTYAVANDAVQYLRSGESKIDTFTITSVDGTSKVVSFTIFGADDAATIGDPTVADVTEDVAVDASGYLSASGIIAIADPDHDQSSFATNVTGDTGNLGALVLAADGSYTYAVPNIAVQYLGAGDSKIDTFTITSVDGTSKVVSFTIFGTNDAALIGTPTVASVTEDVGVDNAGNLTVSGSISINDPDQGQSSFISATGEAGNLGTLALAANGSYTYTVSNAAVQYLGSGESRVETFTVQSVDGTTQAVSFTILGTNDAPTVTGPTSGSVREDDVRALQASGQLTATDPDGGTTSWSIAGGTTSVATQDFRFQVDNLKITKNGFTFFEDTFGDGSPPPSGPAFPPATGINGGAYAMNGTMTEAAGRAFFDGTRAVAFGSAYGERARLNSDTSPISDPANGAKGLKSNSDFVSEARFDLIVPEDIGDAYGIRLTDQISAANNSSVDLVVTRDATGVHVVLRQVNPGANAVTPIQSLDFDPSTGDQIVLRLSYDHTSYINASAGGRVTASFDVLSNGVATSTQTFSSAGTIFVGEDWTQVQLIGQTAQGNESGVYQKAGTYGTLTLAQDGQWHYFLADHQANVQALTEGQVVTDTFSIEVSDGHGGTTSRQIDVTVIGTNDAPTVTGQSAGSVREDDVRSLQTSGQLTATDPDGGTTSWSIAGGTTSATTQDFRFQVDNLKITKNGFTFFEDTFGDGSPPPSGPAFPPATGTNTSAYSMNGAMTEAAGRAFFDGTRAVAFGSAYGERARLLTSIDPISDPVNGAKGLKSNSDFVSEARFDLIVPEDIGDAYGIRLTDQASAQPNNNSSVDLVVTRDATGVHVVLRQVNPGSNAVTPIQSLDFDPSTGDQIVLRLSYDHTSYINASAGGRVTASFDVLSNGVATSTQTFSSPGTIFVGEDFTQVQLIGQTAQGNESGVYQKAGTYGTLTLAQDGQWHYFLADHQANVQALAEGQVVTDTFTVQASDGQGGVTSKQIVINVTGTTDGPILQSDTASNAAVEAGDNTPGEAVAPGNVLFNDIAPIGQTLAVTGFASGYTNAPIVSDFSQSIQGAYGHLDATPDGWWIYTLDNDNPLTDALMDGDHVLDVFTYTARSSNGATANATLTIDVFGSTDTLTQLNPDTASNAAVEAGAGTPGEAVAPGNVLFNDHGAGGRPLTVIGFASGASNAPIISDLSQSIQGTYGHLYVSADGWWDYTLDNSNPLTNALAEGQHATDVFTYTAIDGNFATANSQLTIDIIGANDAPTGVLPPHAMLEGSGLHKLDLMEGTSDPEGDGYHVGIVNSIWSWLTLDADGHTITIDTNDPLFNNIAAGEAIDYFFSYELVDEFGASNLQIATFRIAGTDDRPTTNWDSQNVVIESGGTEAGVSTAQMRLFASDSDVIGINTSPIPQSVYADTSGWTSLGNGIFSKVGLYGSVLWDTNQITAADQQHYTTLTYLLDNDDPDTHALTSSDNVYDSFDVTFTDGMLSTTRNVHFEVVGRSDMSDASATYRFLYPTDQGTAFTTVTDGPATSSVSSGTHLEQITPSESINFGNLIVFYNGADGTVDFSDENITFTFGQDWFAQPGFTDATVLRDGGGVYFSPPVPGDDWLVWYHMSGSAFNGIEITDLPTISRVDLAPGSQDTPFLLWDAHSIKLNFSLGYYEAGSQLDYIVTFRPGDPLYDYGINPPDPFVDVGATNQSIGSSIVIGNGMTFDLNVAYDGIVQFEGPSGTLRLETAGFTGVVDGFATDSQHLDFSAFTAGNASIVGELLGSTLDAHSIGWVTDGTDVMIYVNASDTVESISATDVSVHMQNVIHLHTGSFIV